MKAQTPAPSSILNPLRGGIAGSGDLRQAWGVADVFSKAKRSDVMSRIRGRGNQSTEMRMVALFRAHGISGWRRHLPLPGRPDFAFRREKVAVFVDGCFWHGCPSCYRPPKGNARFWMEKIGGNRRRDRRADRALRERGWSVIRVWECALRKRPGSVAGRVVRILGRSFPA
jgi:DNA mismatch endonuclease, patch repair protein